MNKRILDFIVCPQCKADFGLDIFYEEKGRIKEGLLACTSCKEVYPVIDFIPRIIKGIINTYPDFCRKYGFPINKGPAPDIRLSDTEKLNRKTMKSFGYQWTRAIFSQVIPKFEDSFLNYIYPIQRDFFCGKIGVDIGCGFGRHIYYAAKFGAEMVGIDFSAAINSAYNNTKELPNVHLVQADIYYLPLRNNYFDFIYSIGVLHHLPDPEKGFNALLPLLRPKGNISIWVYSKSRPIVNFTIESIRLITKRIPHKALYFLCIIFSFMEWLYVIIPYKFLNRLPVIRGLINKMVFKRIKTYAKYPFDVLTADWFDRLSAPLRYYYNENDLKSWFTRANLKLVKISPTASYGWRVLGEKDYDYREKP